MAGTVRTSGTVGTGWRRRCGEDSRLIRHDPMDWTTGTLGTVGNDALDFGDWLGTYWTSETSCLTPGTDWVYLDIQGLL